MLYPLVGGQARPLGPVRSLLRGPSFSADGRFLFFEASSTGLREIYRLQLDGQKLTQLTRNREGNFQPRPSPSGDRVVFVSSRDQVAEMGRRSTQMMPALKGPRPSTPGLKKPSNPGVKASKLAVREDDLAHPCDGRGAALG